jgi:ATP-dependent helicase/nuclease subunit A
MTLPWTRFTDDQLRAALLVDRAVVSVAAAGSGKTQVLAVRYCACLLRDRLPHRPPQEPARLTPDRVLAITFTREAAAELRARIDRVLRAILAADPPRFPDPLRSQDGDAALDPDEIDHLTRCLALLPAAPIGTIDGFCLDLVAEHAAALGRDPDLRPPGGNGPEWAESREEAWSALRAEMAQAGGGELLEVVAAYGEPRAKDLVLALAGQTDVVPGQGVAAAAGDPVAELLSRRRVRLDAIPAALAHARQLVKPHTNCGQDLAAAAALAGSVPADPAQLAPWLAAIAGIRGHGQRGEAMAAVRVLRDLVREPRKGASLALLTAYDAAHEARWQHRAAALAHCVRRWRALHSAAAARRGATGFAAIAADALRLLDDPARRARLARRHQHLLLDESQDMNRLQWELVGRLAGPGVRLFAVGDHRQSIYGFRHAEPALFRRCEDAIETGGGERAPLGMNFRSHPALVDAVGALFQVPALCDDFQPDQIRPGRAAADAPGPGTLARWRLLPDFPPDDRAEANRRLHEAQAELVAALVARGIMAGREPGHHAVLLRSRARMRLYAAALERRGIPVDPDYPAGLYQAQEVHDVEAILRLCLDPHDRFALAVAAAGPWSAADPQDRTLMHAALARPDGAGAAAALLDGTPLGAVVAGLRPLLAGEGVASAIRHLAADARLSARYGRLPLARRRLANLAVLAAEEDGAGALDAAAFIARLDARRRLDADAAEASGAGLGGRGVRLLTVHGAKGLEWPVVLVPDLAKRFNAGDRARPGLARIADDGGALELVCGPSADEAVEDGAIGLRHALAAEDLAARQTAEEARLFYVACTRAAAELHLIEVMLKEPDAADADADGLATSVADWLAASPPQVVAVPPDPAPLAPAMAGAVARIHGPAVASAPPPASASPDAPIPTTAHALGATHAATLAATAAAPAARIMAVTDLVALALGESPSTDTVAAGPRAIARALGLAVHAALAAHGPGMDPHHAAAALAPFAGQLDPERLATLARHLADPGLVPGWGQARQRLAEQALVADLVPGDPSRLVSGAADLLLRHADGWRLYDFKTGAAAHHPAAALQLQAYAHMVAPHLDAPLLGLAVIGVETARVIPVPPDPTAWTRLVAAWDGMTMTGNP